MPDINIGLAWGMESEDWREKKDNKPEWPPKEGAQIKSARLMYAHVLYNGAVVWEVGYAYADWGSGIGGCLPWPEAQFSGSLGEPELVGWEPPHGRTCSPGYSPTSRTRPPSSTA